MHTVVIGNGIVALSTAFRLLQRLGPQDLITVIGPRARPGSATHAAAAMLNSFAEIEAGSLEHPVDLFRFELSHLSTRMWPRFEREIIDQAGGCLPADCGQCTGFGGGGCIDTGTFVINNNAADDLDDENFEAIAQALDDFSEPYEYVSPRSIPNYRPHQGQRAVRALFIPGEGWVNPRLMLEKLDMVVGRHPQVRFLEASAERLQHGHGAITGVVLDDAQVVEADTFVLATGASAWDLLQRSDLDIGVQRVFYGVGVSLEIESPDNPHTHCIRTPNRGLACGVYSAPYFTGPHRPTDHILIGASSFTSATPVAHARIGSVESLLKSAMEQINRDFYRASLVRVNVGWRPSSQDGYPMVGRTALRNLIVATGTKRDGFHMAPVLSQYLAGLVHGDPLTDERWHWLAPDRAPLRLLTREQAIAKAVRHQISAAYQHGFVPAKSRMPDQLADSYRSQLEQLHDQIGAVDWGIPPDMLDMYRYGHAKP